MISGPQQILAGRLILFILTDVIGDCRFVPGAVGRGGRRSLGGKGPAEGGRWGAVVCGAAAGTLLWADGLQHPALALLQHVFLVREAGGLLAWVTHSWTWTLLTACAAF